MPFAHASEYEPRPCMSTEPTTYAMVVARHDERIDWLFYYTQHFSLTAFVYMASQKHAGPDHGQPALQRPPSAPARTLTLSSGQPPPISRRGPPRRRDTSLPPQRICLLAELGTRTAAHSRHGRACRCACRLECMCSGSPRPVQP